MRSQFGPLSGLSKLSWYTPAGAFVHLWNKCYDTRVGRPIRILCPYYVDWATFLAPHSADFAGLGHEGGVHLMCISKMVQPPHFPGGGGPVDNTRHAAPADLTDLPFPTLMYKVSGVHHTCCIA